MPTIYIYSLIDPRNEEIRYVGKAKNPAQRLTHHLKDKGDCHRTRWLNVLKELGLQPSIGILAECDEESWQERERFWIASLRERGCDLRS